MSHPKKILVRGVNWLGDAVMSMPAIQRLKEALPGAEITILTPEKLGDLWRMHPCVEDVIAITPEETVFQVGRRLRWGTFEAAITFPNSPRSALELWLGRIPQRAGYSRPWRNVFLTQKVPARPGEVKMHKRSVAEINELISSPGTPQAYAASSHHVHQYLHLVAAVFGANLAPVPPMLCVPDADVKKFLGDFGIALDNRPVLGINPGAEYGPAKRWPAERFVTAAVALTQKTGCRWIIFGGKADMPLASKVAVEIQAGIQRDDAVVTVAGRTSLRELCAGLKACRVVLTNDTGPMHLATAVGTPVVVPFGSTSPELTAPMTAHEAVGEFIKSDAPCSPCFLRECPIDFRCMNGIPVESMVEAALRVIGRRL